jgi:hypothetical protein
MRSGGRIALELERRLRHLGSLPRPRSQFGRDGFSHEDRLAYREAAESGELTLERIGQLAAAGTLKGQVLMETANLALERQIRRFDVDEIGRDEYDRAFELRHALPV